MYTWNVLLCVCGCACLCMCVSCACAYVCGGQSIVLPIITQVTCPLFGSSHSLAWSSRLRLGWLAPKPLASYLHLLRAGISSVCHHPQLFLYGFWRFSLGRHACLVSALPADPTSQLHSNLFPLSHPPWHGSLQGSAPPSSLFR